MSAKASGSSTNMKVSFHCGFRVVFRIRVRALKGPKVTLQKGSEDPPMSAPRRLLACKTCSRSCCVAIAQMQLEVELDSRKRVMFACT